MTAPSAHPWLERAWADLGLAAIPGPDTEARVTAYYADAGHHEIAGDDVAWCAAFVGACLSRAGFPGTRSLLARSYLTYGTSLTGGRPGAIAIFSRGSDPSLGHVAFVVGETADALLILGGNQSHAVSVAVMPRSRLLALRWPPIASNTSISVAPELPDAAFDRALSHVLEMEGGYTNDAFDPGGATNLGITLADLARFRGVAITDELIPALKALTPGDVVPIYRTFYWDRCAAAQLPPALALFHFDTAVNHGIGAASRMLQQALAVELDGEVGPLTLAAAASSDVRGTLAAYAEIRRARYRALSTFWRFGRGWLGRVDATLAAAAPLATERLPIRARTGAPNPTPSELKKENRMSDTAAPVTLPTQPKWWGQSLTIWGTLITTLSTVLPVVGPMIGLEISSETVHQLGDGVVRTAQALGGVIGVVMAIYGRTRAMQPLVRRDFQLKL